MIKIAALLCLLATGCTGQALEQAPAPLEAEAGSPAEVAGQAGTVAAAGSAPVEAGAGGAFDAAGASSGGAGAGAGGMPEVAGQAGAVAVGGQAGAPAVGGAGAGGSPDVAGSSSGAAGAGGAGAGGAPEVAGSSSGGAGAGGAPISQAGAGGAPISQAGAGAGGQAGASSGGAPGVPCPYHMSTEGIDSQSHRLTFSWTTFQIVLAVDLTPLAGYSVIPYVDGIQSAKAFPANGMYSIPPINRMKSFAVEVVPNTPAALMPATGLDLYCKP